MTNAMNSTDKVRYAVRTPNGYMGRHSLSSTYADNQSAQFAAVFQTVEQAERGMFGINDGIVIGGTGYDPSKWTPIYDENDIEDDGLDVEDPDDRSNWSDADWDDHRPFDTMAEDRGER